MTILFLIYGLFIGSFLNVCIYRIPSGISIIKPPSSCGSCGHKLNYIDMIPVVSYIVNKGKCRYCGSNYSVQYPLIEILNGLLYVLVYTRFGLTLSSVLYCLIISLLITISIIDLRHKIIPDGLNITGLVLGIIYIIINQKLIDGLTGAAIGFGLFLLIALITNAMGGGDIKLMAVLGLIFGIKGILLITLSSFVTGAVISVILLAMKIKSRKDEIPFGPFISLSALIYIFFGSEIINWYFELFKLH
ncbi:prepilin peptidase [Sedimentibacter hydroxybenzoicus DSM 7310]|uniref:Prepilin peptidase n=1 Tax=Sedimentibacter hydroxybenzoicus DSM 7310 TaxID=1123245 RepID=A0A974BJG1_SEDHY|nr:A24 family peptidase [Sedimentibacter hydroxybenzoicus]NYB74298.1 prepilin peptidase [Sedimentibacter hydroxybenzoicus DSM 7310]